jgi:hypothetical protein
MTSSKLTVFIFYSSADESPCRLDGFCIRRRRRGKMWSAFGQIVSARVVTSSIIHPELQFQYLRLEVQCIDTSLSKNKSHRLTARDPDRHNFFDLRLFLPKIAENFAENCATGSGWDSVVDPKHVAKRRFVAFKKPKRVKKQA